MACGEARGPEVLIDLCPGLMIIRQQEGAGETRGIQEACLLDVL